jgi:hypothetical protein
MGVGVPIRGGRPSGKGRYYFALVAAEWVTWIGPGTASTRDPKYATNQIFISATPLL